MNRDGAIYFQEKIGTNKTNENFQTIRKIKNTKNSGSEMLATLNVGYTNQFGVVTVSQRWRRREVATATPRQRLGVAAASPPRRRGDA